MSETSVKQESCKWVWQLKERLSRMSAEMKTTYSKSWKLLGVEFAPIILPIERRLQTLSVFVWIWMILFLGLVSTGCFLYMLVYTRLWWVSLAYFTWMLVDRKTSERGGRSGLIRKLTRNSSLWKHYVNYFPIRLVKTSELDPDKNYILGSHPHGLLASGCFGAFATEGADVSKVFPGLEVHVHTLAVNFWFPLNREWILGLGAASASRESISYLQSKKGGQASVIVIGGAAESIYTSQYEISLVLKKRKGFIKMALKHGSQLVPTFSFGEAHVYNILPTPIGSWIRNLQEYVRHVVGIAPVIFFGRGMFQYNMGMIPHRKPIHVVVGTPIHVTKTENPTVEEVEELHRQYMDALVDLYNKYNCIYGDENIKLKLI